VRKDDGRYRHGRVGANLYDLAAIASSPAHDHAAIVVATVCERDELLTFSPAEPGHDDSGGDQKSDPQITGLGLRFSGDQCVK
jgi:hypothetical protein